MTKNWAFLSCCVLLLLSGCRKNGRYGIRRSFAQQPNYTSKVKTEEINSSENSYSSQSAYSVDRSVIYKPDIEQPRFSVEKQEVSVSVA